MLYKLTPVTAKRVRKRVENKVKWFKQLWVEIKYGPTKLQSIDDHDTIGSCIQRFKVLNHHMPPETININELNPLVIIHVE